MFTAAQVQKAYERVAIQTEEDFVNEIFELEIEHTEEQYLTVNIEKADRDSINVGPLVDNGDGSHTMLVTVQVTIRVNEDK